MTDLKLIQALDNRKKKILLEEEVYFMVYYCFTEIILQNIGNQALLVLLSFGEGAATG